MDERHFEANRPDPDQLLSQLQSDEKKSERAKLKIYFGFAPGVGKTFSMLEWARRAHESGVDLLLGVVESHGRSETKALLEGLPVLPMRKISHGAATLGEFDLDEALARKPAVLLIDELAHTNAPTSRNRKRWQDVFECLDAGIEVHTALNVQHVQSLNDAVMQITGIRVREMVPDLVLDRADEIELVDIPVEELQKRLTEGKVYLGAQAAHARENFFRFGNLLALRELALRRIAERVDIDVRAYRERHRIQTQWPTRERVLVGVSASLTSMPLLRAARRMVDQSNGTMVAVYVDALAARNLSSEEEERLHTHLNFAESLGAEVVRTSAATVSEAILRAAREQNATRILVGKPLHSRLRDRLRGSLLDDLVRGAVGVDVQVVSIEEALPAPSKRSPEAKTTEVTRVALALGLVGLATMLAHFLFRWVELPDVVMLFLAAVMFSAYRFGLKASLAASFASVLAYDFFFVPPLYTFNISDARHLLTFAMLFVVAVSFSSLTTRLARREKDASSRAARLASLYAFVRDLGRASERVDLAKAIAEHIERHFDFSTWVFFPHLESKVEVAVASARSHSLHDPNFAFSIQALASWSALHLRACGTGTDTLPGARAYAVPVCTGDVLHAVLVVEDDTKGPSVAAPSTRAMSTEQRRFLEVLVQQASLAFERMRLHEEQQAAILETRSEGLRSALLSTLSHDLRTPLGSIAGSASTLLLSEKNDAHAMPEALRTELLQSVYSESSRLAQLVNNILDVTRLELGHTSLNREWIPVDELVGGAIESVSALRNMPIEIRIEPVDALIFVDSLAFSRALANLLENAFKHAAGKPIRIAVHREPNRAKVSVEDAGPGIAEALREKVFQRFARGDTQDGRGVGLGLSIVRAIVLAHDGKVFAQSSEMGGAMIVIELPQPSLEPEML